MPEVIIIHKPLMYVLTKFLPIFWPCKDKPIPVFIFIFFSFP